MATIVKGDLYYILDGKLCEIKRQLRQREGYPFDPKRLDDALQAAIEGRFEAVLVKQAEAETKPREWPIWKTIQLGTGLKTADDFRRALKDGGYHLSDWAKDILGQPAFTTASQETEVDLVMVSVAELGLKDGAVRQDIYQRAQELGLELCPPEVGPQLRLQYKDQSMDEWLLIGMEPIIDSDGILDVFHVERGGGGLWLYGNYGRPDRFWDGHDRWVFLRPQVVLGHCPFGLL